MAAESLDEGWKDARVRHAEQALAEAVRTADDIIAAAERAVTGRTAPPPEPEHQEQSVLRDAW